jgi:hypothetical protein
MASSVSAGAHLLQLFVFPPLAMAWGSDDSGGEPVFLLAPYVFLSLYPT